MGQVMDVAKGDEGTGLFQLVGTMPGPADGEHPVFRTMDPVNGPTIGSQGGYRRKHTGNGRKGRKRSVTVKAATEQRKGAAVRNAGKQEPPLINMILSFDAIDQAV